MERAESRVIYCVDTSSLVTLQRIYPRAIFPSLWARLASLGRAGRLVAPREVFNELQRGGDDDIAAWAKEQREIFRDPDAEQIAVVTEIVNDPALRGLFDVESDRPDADPYVIGLAVVGQRQNTLFEERWVVVADEARARPGRKPRIPDVCRDPRYRLEAIHILDLFRREGWQF